MSEDDEEPVDPDVESEPELIVPELPEVPGREELAPEPAPLPMLPDCVSRLDEDDERLLSELELELDDLLLLFHLLNSDCDSEPSLLLSAVLKAPLRSELIAASVCEMRPSRLASSELKVAVPELELPEPELIEPELIEPEPWPIDELLLLLGGLEVLGLELDELLLPGLVVELCPYAVAAITAAATALITADFFMIGPRVLKVEVTGPCWPRHGASRDVEKLRHAHGRGPDRARHACSDAPTGSVRRLAARTRGWPNITYYSAAWRACPGCPVGSGAGPRWARARPRAAHVSRRRRASYRTSGRPPTRRASRRQCDLARLPRARQPLESPPLTHSCGDCSA